MNELEKLTQHLLSKHYSFECRCDECGRVFNCVNSNTLDDNASQEDKQKFANMTPDENDYVVCPSCGKRTAHAYGIKYLNEK